MSDNSSAKPKRQQPRQQRPSISWLDPTAELTEEEEVALDEIMANIPRSVVEAANRETARDATEQTERQERPRHDDTTRE